jgi:hypothetical protein
MSADTRCAGCGAAYSRAAWGTLQPVRRLEPPELGGLVVAWPSDRAVEVRECRQCGRALARLSPRGIGSVA